MMKSLYEELGGTYTLGDDGMLYPDLAIGDKDSRPIGKWGRLHRAYLQQYRPVSFYALVLSGKLHTYLADLNEQATARCSLIIEQMMKAEGVTEAMKAANQLLWVQSMNSIRDRAEEIIKHELIYCDDAERRA